MKLYRILHHQSEVVAKTYTNTALANTYTNTISFFFTLAYMYNILIDLLDYYCTVQYLKYISIYT